MKLVDPTQFPDTYVALEYLASAPYLTFVYGEQARAIAQFIWEQQVGESAPPHGYLALDEHDQPVAMMAFLDGDQLRRSRTAVATALVRSKMIDPRGDARERMLLAADTLISVAADDMYLSRIAVDESARGRGVAGALLRQLEAQASAAGKRQIVLEVSNIHETARHLYERAGFSTIGARRVEDPVTGRQLEYHHMAKSLS